MDKTDVGVLAAMILVAPHMSASVANVTGGVFIVMGMLLSCMEHYMKGKQ